MLLVSGMMNGAVYGLVALGFVLIYKASAVLNFAQGYMLLLGAYLFWFFKVTLALPLPLALVLSMAAGFLVGALTERLALRRLTTFDAGHETIRRLGVIVAYAMTVNVFFLFLELFTALYSGMPDHAEPFAYLFFGIDGKNGLVPVMWLSVVLALAALLALLVPRFRRNERVLALASLAVFVSLWLEKGMGLIVAGFVPSPLRTVTSYAPTAPEWGIVGGVWAVGALMLTLFYKITVSVREAD